MESRAPRSDEPASTTVDLDALGPEQLRARRTMKWNRYPADVLPLWVAEMDYPTAPPVLQALKAAVEAETLGYPLDAATSGLGASLAGWLGREHGWAVEPDQVHLVPNVVRGMGLALDTLCDDGPVVIPTPAYLPFFDVVRLRGREVVPVPMLRATPADDAPWVLDLEGIESALLQGARAVILCNPHNPLGHVHTRDELLELAEVVERHGARVVSDDIHAPLVLDGTHLPYAGLSPTTAGHTVTVLSASKAWNLPGLTCAQVVTSSEADTLAWRAIPHEKTIGVGTLGIEANLAAYEHGGPWLAQVRERLTANARLVADAVAAMPGVEHRVNEATYLAWLDLSALGLDVPASDWLIEHAGVALSEGAAFGAPEHRYARLNFATTAPILDEALGRIAKAVAAR